MHQAAGLPIPSLLSHVLLPLPRASVCVGGGGGGRERGCQAETEKETETGERKAAVAQTISGQVLIFFFSRATSRLVKRLGPKERH